jgi:Na+/H+ antiporter
VCVHTELTLLALVIGAVAVTWVCRRFDVSAPLVLVVVGIAASFLPGVELIGLDPPVVMLVVLVPLLYSAALESSYRGMRANLRPIGLLAVGLVTFTAFAVGLVAWWVVPGLPLASALVLGAVVAPPDAVSALAVGRRLGLPRRMMTILGGESLVNDATALTLFRVFAAVAAGTELTVLHLSTGLPVPVVGVLNFLVAAVGGALVGLAMGWLVHQVRRRIDDPNIEAAIGLIVPFAVYLVAEEAETSGVLAVVVAGLYLGNHAAEGGYASRLQEAAVWQASNTVLESVVFALIGLQLTAVVAQAGEIGPLLVAGIATTAAAVLARIVWVFPGTYVPRLLFRRIRERDPYPPWTHPVVLSWAGMRGVVSLAAAIALAPDFPSRDLVLYLTFVVVIGTLLLQGLTLPKLIRLLGVTAQEEATDNLAEAAAQHAAANAALERLEVLATEDGQQVPDDVVGRLREKAELRQLGAWERLGGRGSPDGAAMEPPTVSFRRLRRAMIEAEREVFIDLRDRGRIDDEVLRRVQHELDLEEALLARE